MYLPLAGSYLAARGLDLEHARTYRLGVVEDPEVGHEPYADRLAIPYVTRNGVINIKFRCMEQHDCGEHGHEKYYNLGGTGDQHIYNVGAFFRDSQRIGICEGEFDTQVIDRYVMPCVGIGGAKAWKDFYPKCFADYEQVYMFSDGDKAGRAFAKDVQYALEDSEVVMVRMPLGTDVNEIYVQEGAEGLRERAGLNG